LGAEHALAVEGLGQGLPGVLALGEQEDRGGQRTGVGGGGPRGTSSRVSTTWTPVSGCGSSRTARVRVLSLTGSTAASTGRVWGSARGSSGRSATLRSVGRWSGLLSFL